MPKQLPIDPGQTYSADKVRFTDIPIHAYNGDLAAEIARWDLRRGDALAAAVANALGGLALAVLAVRHAEAVAAG